MKIAIGNDHAATELKFVIMDYLKELGHEVINFGTDTSDSCNYPEYGEKVGRAVVAGEADCGVLICGTGVGISIAANIGCCGREKPPELIDFYHLPVMVLR